MLRTGNMINLRTFINGLPKVELHLHLEGTLEPEMMFTLARRNGLNLRWNSAAELRASYQFSGLQSFLDLYYQATATLVTARDFYDLTRAYLARAARDNVRHAEVFFDPQSHTARGVTFETAFGGIHQALEESRDTYGISNRLIMCFLRDRAEADAMKTLEQALPFKQWLAGVGLDSAEAGHPPAQFARVFARAREAGLHVVAHAGEEGPPDYIRQALDILGAERIDHGVRALEDPALTADLAARQIPLTVCPLSNVRLGVFSSMARHNLKRLLEAGLMVTINSDDPAYFGGYVGENYIAAQAALDLSREQICELAANGFTAAFISDHEKKRYLQELADYVKAH
ncbi:MAG: adenosine deaminase [Candidatus Binataceae bacterium]